MATKTIRRLNLDPTGGPLYVDVPIDDSTGNRTGENVRKGNTQDDNRPASNDTPAPSHGSNGHS
jgi:hypothetical protein